MTLSFAEVLARFGPYKQTGKEYRVHCPAHDDSSPSLDITEGDIGPLFFCRAHCQTADILAAKGLTWGDVLPQHNGHRDDWDHVYEYRDRAGTIRYRVHRRDAKGSTEKVIKQQAANGAWSLKGITPLPYRLPELNGPVILVAEGEKAVDALFAAGYEATTNSGGASNWRDTDSAALKEIGITTLVILPDNDEAGLKHAAKVESSAAKFGITTRRAILPGLPPSGDAADWLATHTADELDAALKPPPPPLLPALLDSISVSARGQQIESEGIRFVIEGILPNYGLLGFLVAAAKVGKSSFGLALAEAVATGSDFLGRHVEPCKVLIVAAEDPPEYVAWMARHLIHVPAERITFSRAPLQLNADGLERITNTIKYGGYGLVLISSWQAVITSLVKDENDNAGAVAVVERVKLAAHASGIPWLIDAHAGKTEDQSDDADPTKALRGASAAAGAADFLLSLRYTKGSFTNKRRLSGKGRFVNLETVVIEYDTQTGRYDIAPESSRTATKSALAETTWQMILETGALGEDWSGVGAIAVRAGLCDSSHGINGGIRKKVYDALFNRPGVGYWKDPKHNNRPMFRLGDGAPPP